MMTMIEGGVSRRVSKPARTSPKGGYAMSKDTTVIAFQPDAIDGPIWHARVPAECWLR
jgi:hypothetical protein